MTLKTEVMAPEKSALLSQEYISFLNIKIENSLFKLL